MKQIELSKIKPNPDNPRFIKDTSFAKLVESIKTFPEMLSLRPIVVDENMMVLGGNMRLRACTEAGLKKVQIIEAKDLSDEQKREFIIKDNLAFGEWSWDTLANEWDKDLLTDWGLDVGSFSYDEGQAEQDEFQIEDDFPVDVILGDLIEIGEHRLLCGDCTDSDLVQKLMNDQQAELLFTSPPYSDMRDYNGEKELSVNHLSDFIPSWMPFVQYQVINLGIQRKDNDIFEYWNDYISKARACGYKMLSWNVWAKPSAGSIGNQSAFFPIAHEWIFVFGKKFKDINRTKKRVTPIKPERVVRDVRQADGSMKESTVGKQGKLKEMESVFFSNPELGTIRALHPATFPVELPTEYIKAITKEDDIIAESFAGSGTTMVAAHQLNRKCYATELDPKYCQVIINRMMDLDQGIEVKINGKSYGKKD